MFSVTLSMSFITFVTVGHNIQTRDMRRQTTRRSRKCPRSEWTIAQTQDCAQSYLSLSHISQPSNADSWLMPPSASPIAFPLIGSLIFHCGGDFLAAQGSVSSRLQRDASVYLLDTVCVPLAVREMHFAAPFYRLRAFGWGCPHCVCTRLHAPRLCLSWGLKNMAINPAINNGRTGQGVKLTDGIWVITSASRWHDLGGRLLSL